MNVLAELRLRLRGGPCRPFTAEGSVETLPGQIRRPDLGIDGGRRDPNGFEAAEPRLVLEVRSPGTRDFDTFEKLGQYKTVETLDHLVFVEPDLPLVVHWTRGADHGWTRRSAAGPDATLAFPKLGVTLALAEVYDGVEFPPGLRPL